MQGRMDKGGGRRSRRNCLGTRDCGRDKNSK